MPPEPNAFSQGSKAGVQPDKTGPGASPERRDRKF